MGKRKYARHSDVYSKNYECTKKSCKWQGTIEEQDTIKVEEGHYRYVCPKCGNSDFYNLI